MTALYADDIEKSFLKSRETYDREAFIQSFMAKMLIKEISKLSNDFDTIFEAGSGSGIFTAHIKKELNFNRLFVNDIVYKKAEYPNISCDEKTHVVAGDICSIDIPRDISLFCSNAMLQWIADKKALFDRIYASLSPFGIAAMSSFGPDNFLQIRSITGVGLNYPTLLQLKNMLADCGFDVLTVKEKRLNLFFSSARELVRHIKKTGVNACGKGWRGSVRNLITEYEKRFKRNNGVYLTYHPVWFIARKRV